MGYLSLVNIKTEFLYFLRNSDLYSISDRSVTTKTDTFTASGGAETFTLSKTNVKNVRVVNDNGSPLSYGSEYTINFESSNQVAVSKSLTVGNTITIQFDYGSDIIFMEFPRPDLKISSYPRVAFNVYALSTEAGGFGNVNQSKFRFEVHIFEKSKYQMDTKLDLLRQKVIDAQTSLYYLSYMKPLQTREVDIFNLGNNKIYRNSFEIEVRNLFEIN